MQQWAGPWLQARRSTAACRGWITPLSTLRVRERLLRCLHHRAGPWLQAHRSTAASCATSTAACRGWITPLSTLRIRDRLLHCLHHRAGPWLQAHRSTAACRGWTTPSSPPSTTDPIIGYKHTVAQLRAADGLLPTPILLSTLLILLVLS